MPAADRSADAPSPDGDSDDRPPDGKTTGGDDRPAGPATTGSTTDDDGPVKVAVACQGGGSHTAFTAGVLTRLLGESDPDFEVTALTGTSGGALCALLAWYGLQTADGDRAAAYLADLWEDLAAAGVGDAATNAAVVTATAALHAGLPVPQVSPAHVTADDVARARLVRAIERHVDPNRLRSLVDRDDPPLPSVLVSAVDVADGRFETFSDRPEQWRDEDDSRDGAETAQLPGVPSSKRADRIRPAPRPLSVDAVLASAAVPTVFEAVEIPDESGREHAYWDGLFSQNPPVRNLLSGRERAHKPDEIWLVRINPERRPENPTRLAEIYDRRNELSGSLSLYQELHFVRTVNDWLRAGRFEASFADRLKPVTVRQIELDESRLDPPRRLLAATKVDRAPGLLADLRRLGAEQAGEFLADRTAARYLVVE